MIKSIKNILIMGLTISMCGSINAYAAQNSKKYSESRIYGNNRYETSENIANNFNNNSNNKIKNIILASGENFPDALSGSSIAVKQNAVILLVNDKSASDLKKCLDCCSINNLTQLSHIKMMVEA